MQGGVSRALGERLDLEWVLLDCKFDEVRHSPWERANRAEVCNDSLGGSHDFHFQEKPNDHI